MSGETLLKSSITITYVGDPYVLRNDCIPITGSLINQKAVRTSYRWLRYNKINHHSRPRPRHRDPTARVYTREWMATLSFMARSREEHNKNVIKETRPSECGRYKSGWCNANDINAGYAFTKCEKCPGPERESSIRSGTSRRASESRPFILYPNHYCPPLS